MFLVVAAKEPAAEVESVVMAGEAGWEVGSVLQRLELALGEGVVGIDGVCCGTRGTPSVDISCATA